LVLFYVDHLRVYCVFAVMFSTVLLLLSLSPSYTLCALSLSFTRAHTHAHTPRAARPVAVAPSIRPSTVFAYHLGTSLMGGEHSHGRGRARAAGPRTVAGVGDEDEVGGLVDAEALRVPELPQLAALPPDGAQQLQVRAVGPAELEDLRGGGCLRKGRWGGVENRNLRWWGTCTGGHRTARNRFSARRRRLQVCSVCVGRGVWRGRLCKGDSEGAG
jgi:hypothetical protein